MVQWRNIPLLDGAFEISDRGVVRSNGSGDVVPKDYTGGRPVVRLDGRDLFVDELVLLAFKGYPGESGGDQAYTASHSNGYVEDCRLANLEWTEASERDGDDELSVGDQKLSDRDVREIRRRLASNGAPAQTELADEYGVTQPLISDIWHAKTRQNAGGPTAED